MARALLIDPFSGASGDMLLAALVDAGASVDRIRDQVLTIPELKGMTVDVKDVERNHFAAKQLAIDLPHEHAHRGLADVTRIIDGAPNLSDRTRRAARETFARLAMAEARAHGKTIEDVHFHEVGALDAILDIVGFYVATEELKVERFVYTSLLLGGGSVNAAHGEIPIPAPATVELLRDHDVRFSGRDEELITPTAAAIIAESFEPLGTDRTFKLGVTGYGAGTRESQGLPNLLRIVVGEVSDGSRHVAVIRCTIDDMNPELYGHVMSQLFAQGALEVYFDAVMMKKNRPGVEVTVIAEERDAHRTADWLLTNTSTLGLRLAREQRVELERRVDEVETELGRARVKVGVLPDGSEKASPEYESCRALAEKHNRPIADVYELIRRAWTDARS